MRDSYSFIEQIHKSYKFFLSLADNHCTKDKANKDLQENPRVKEELIIDEPTKRETITVTTEQNNNSHELKNLDNVSVELIKDALDVDKMFSINKEYM